MTAREAIELADGLKPNNHSREHKLSWLARLDAKIYHELLRTHENAPEFTQISGESAELLVPEPWCGDVYNYYLQSMIDRENGETAKYNQSAALYNQAYLEYCAFYNRTHAPVPTESRFVF